MSHLIRFRQLFLVESGGHWSQGESTEFAETHQFVLISSEFLLDQVVQTV